MTLWLLRYSTYQEITMIHSCRDCGHHDEIDKLMHDYLGRQIVQRRVLHNTKPLELIGLGAELDGRSTTLLP